jgi:hypothetical protein
MFNLMLKHKYYIQKAAVIKEITELEQPRTIGTN